MHVHFKMWVCLFGVFSVTGVLGIDLNYDDIPSIMIPPIITNEETNSVYKVYNRDQCSKLCDYSSMCGGFSYRIGDQFSDCRLFSKDTMTENQPEEFSGSTTQDLYYRKTYQKRHSSPSPCDSRQCEENSFCFPVLGTRSFYCQKRKIDCGPYVPPTTMENVITTLTTSYGAVNLVRCKHDLYRNSNVNVRSTCRPDSTWSPPDIVCQEKYCSPENIPEGMELKVNRNYSLGTEAVIGCRYGWYNTSGSEATACLKDETWKINLVCERVRCPIGVAGSDMNSMKMTAMSGEEPVFEVEVTIVCATGYNAISGTGILTCQGDGTWSTFDLKCQIVDCGSPPQPDTSTMDFQSPVTRTVYQSQVQYECTGVYRKYGGGDTITCGETGSWTLRTLDCRLVCVGDPVTPDKAYAVTTRPTNSFVGQKIEYACKEENNYYYESGPTVSVCKLYFFEIPGWSSVSDMKCVYKCSMPEDPFPGTNYNLQPVTDQNFYIGVQVKYNCVLLGTTVTAVCQEGGWNLQNNGLLCQLPIVG